MICLYNNERERYEADTLPDIDNILKVILDALCGPEGIMIDDAQVQSLTIYWLDTPSDNHQIEITLNFFPDEWKSKEGLEFIQFHKGLCFPINTHRNKNAQII